MIDFQVNQEKCGGCGLCAADCPMGIIALEKGLPVIPKGGEERCIHCLHCFAICEAGAITMQGHRAEDIVSLDEGLPSPAQMEGLIKSRRSIRNYLNENLEPALIERMLAVAGRAPSGKNDRKLLFTVVDDLKVLARLREEAMAALSPLVKSGRLAAGLEFFAEIVEAWQIGKIDILFRGAPHLLVVSSPHDAVTPLPDAVIALTTFEFFAQSLGVGTVWNGLSKLTIADLVPSLRSQMGIPDDHLIGYAMSFGWPAVRYARIAPRPAPLINWVRLER